MIQETHHKIYFTEYTPTQGREKDTDSPPTVRLTIKDSSISFCQRTLIKLQLDGKFIKFFYEPVKKIIGWTIHNTLSDGELATKKYRLVKCSSVGSYNTTIMGILRMFSSNFSKNSYKLEVKKYVENQDILSKGDTYYYVQITDEYEETN